MITEFDPLIYVSAYPLLGRNLLNPWFEGRNLFYNSFPEFRFDPSRSRQPRKAQYSYPESASIPQDRDSPARPKLEIPQDLSLKNPQVLLRPARRITLNTRGYVITIPITRNTLSLSITRGENTLSQNYKP
jgi:hypothetical protein